MKDLRFAIKILFQAIRLETELNEKSLRDLCIRPDLIIGKRTGEPKLFRIHKSLNQFLASMRKKKILSQESKSISSN